MSEESGAYIIGLSLQKFAWLPIVVISVSAALLLSQDPGLTYESPVLLATLNTLFCAAVGLLTVSIATKSYLSFGSKTVLFLSSGALLFALTYLLAGMLLHNLNAAITFHNMGLFLAAVCFASSAGLAMKGGGQESQTGSLTDAGFVYLGVISGIALLAWSALSGLIPVFWSPETGMTLVRQVVLGATVAGFASTAFCFGILFTRSKFPFHLWFSMSMVLMSLGMVILIIEGSPATLISWTGRIAQYCGGLYLLAAVVTLGTGTGNRQISLETAMRNTEIWERESEGRYRTLFEKMTEGFVLLEVIPDDAGRPVDYRFLEINPAFDRFTGLKRDHIIGRMMHEILPDEDLFLVEKFGAVAVSGESAHFEYYSPSLKRHYNVLAMSLNNRQIAILFTDITPQKAVEEALRRGEERLRLAQEASGAGIWDWNLKTNELIWDAQLYALFGLNPEQERASFEVWNRILHPDDRKPANSRIELALREHTSLDSDYRIILHDGRTRWINASGRGFYDEMGNPVSMKGICIDISERKQAEESLRESETRLMESRDLLEAVTKGTDVIIAAQDADFRYTYFNKAYADEIKRLTGRELSLGMSMIELFDHMPDQQRNAVRQWSRILAGESVNETMHFGDPGIRQRTYHILHTPIFGADGKVTGAGEVAYDITEQARIEHELGETKKHLENLINYANAPILVWDPEFRITRFNHAFEHLTGRRSGEVIGQHLGILLPENYMDEAMALIKKTMKGERWESVEIPILHKDGGIKTVLWNSASIYGSDGITIESIIAQGQDITERKKIEKELKERAAELEEVNTLLNEEIANRESTEAILKNTLSLLNAALESTADGIIVVNLEGEITSYNKNFSEMWKLKRDLMETRNSRLVADSMMVQLKDPRYFMAEMNDLAGHLERESSDMLELQDGRIFERYTKPQKFGEIVVGRLWSYRDITDRRTAEERLVASLREKEILLREIHHRVKNNLQLISGLLDMTRMRTTDESTYSILSDMMLKIQTMAQIHTRLYESRQFGRISLEDQVHDQIASILAIYTRPGSTITTEIHSDGIYLPVDQAIPCALVINEILSNAFKHAFLGRENGFVRITASQNEGHILISVKDDGIGLPDEFNIYDTGSLGMKLVRNLVENQLKGTLTFRSRNGTEVLVRFPAASSEGHG